RQRVAADSADAARQGTPESLRRPPPRARDLRRLVLRARRPDRRQPPPALTRFAAPLTSGAGAPPCFDPRLASEAVRSVPDVDEAAVGEAVDLADGDAAAACLRCLGGALDHLRPAARALALARFELVGLQVEGDAEAGDQEGDREDHADVEEVDQAVERVARVVGDRPAAAEADAAHRSAPAGAGPAGVGAAGAASGTAAAPCSSPARSSVKVRVRVRVRAKATVPTRRPTTVAPKASRRSFARVPTSPPASAASPGISGISVPIRPIAGPA